MRAAARIACTVLLLCGTAVAVAAPAQARPQARSRTVGNDISWPQCGASYPTGQAFGIVGLTGGLASNVNPCFASEWAWALRSSGVTAQPKAAVYINTGNPSGAGPVWWPTSNTFFSGSDGSDTNAATARNTEQVTVPADPYGTCSPSAADDAACAYVYGWAKAYEDYRHFAPAALDLGSVPWWLDVETTNSWEPTSPSNPAAARANVASLRGMLDELHSLAIVVGVYSTSYQWQQITGTSSATAADPFAGVPNWAAGASASNATSFCGTGHAFTYGSRVSVVQYVAGRFDDDVTC